jgi:O-Antigen ligase
MIILSLALFMSSILYGYSMSKQAAWVILVLYPLFTPMNLAIVPSETLFLNIDRVAFAVALGIHLKNWKSFRVKIFLKNKFIKIFLIFSLYVVLISLSDRLKNILFEYIPKIYLSLILGFYIVKTEKDFYKVIKIFAWQGALFGFIILLQFFHIYDIPKTLRLLLPNPSLETFQDNIYRSGVLRVSGAGGNSVKSGAALIFLFPIAYIYLKREKYFYKFIPITLILIGIVFLLTRAIYVGLVVSLLYYYGMIIKRSYGHFINSFSQIIKSTLMISVLALALFTIPTVNKIFSSFAVYVSSGESNESVRAKTARFTEAIRYIKEKPLLGSGSPQKAYFELMNTQDLPSPFIYTIAGGFPLLILFLAMVYYMPATIIKYSKYKIFSLPEKLDMLLLSSAFLAGLVSLFSVWSEAHVPVMVLFYVITYKYILIKKKKYLNKLINNTN